MTLPANRHRLVWPTQVGGFLVAIGFLTGLANMAFFPSAVCAQGQAGNFVAVYFLCVILIGFPLTYLHLCLGQYSGCNPTSVFGKLCPAFKGIGWCWLLLTIPMMIISNMNTAWSLYYMYLSGRAMIMDSALPWSFPHSVRFPSREMTGSLIDFFAAVEKETNSSSISTLSLWAAGDPPSTTPDYFHHLYHTAAPQMLMSVDDDMVLRVIDKKIVLGTIETRIVTVLALSWIIVSMCTIHNSVHTMNHIVYVTATLPLLILAILLTRVLCLPGAFEGMALLCPDIQRIAELSVWQNAIKLVFFDMQIGVGVLISISKHNRFHTNVFRDSILLVMIDVIVSLAAALVAFGFLGFLAHNLESSDIRAMCRGQVAPHLLWDQILRSMSFLRPSESSVFCFLYQMMLALGAIECSFTMCEYFASALDGKVPIIGGRPCVLRAMVAVVMFLLTLPCCFQSGVHIYNLLVHYSMHWNLKVVALCQFVVVVFVYGVENLLADVRRMLRLPAEECSGRIRRVVGPTGLYVRYSWTWLCPLVITIALGIDLFSRSADRRARKVGDSMLWHFLSMVSIIPLPAIVAYHIYAKVSRFLGFGIFKDKNAFKSIEWKDLQMPYDDSTICNNDTPTTSATTELESIRVADRAPKRLLPQWEFPTKSPNSVNFVLNTNPYFDISDVSTSLLASAAEPEKRFGAAAVGNLDDSADNVSSLLSAEAADSDDDSQITTSDSDQDDDDDDMGPPRDQSPPPLPSAFGNLTTLTGQPGFFVRRSAH